MRRYFFILAGLSVTWASAAGADTEVVPMNSLLLAQATSGDSGSDSSAMGDGTQGNNPANGNADNSNNAPSTNYTPPTQYVVPENPNSFRQGRGTPAVNIQ